MSTTTPIDLLNFFDAVLVLNLPARTAKLAAFQAETQRVKWPFKPPMAFAATDGRATEKKSGVWGSLVSHQAMLQKAIDDKANTVLLLEDDAIFVDDFAARAASFLAAVPADWDQLMFGGQNIRPVRRVKPGVVQCERCMKLHCTALRGQFMQTLNAAWSAAIASNSTQLCGKIMVGLQSAAKVYAPMRFIAGQRGGASDLNGGFMPFHNFWG